MGKATFTKYTINSYRAEFIGIQENFVWSFSHFEWTKRVVYLARQCHPYWCPSDQRKNKTGMSLINYFGISVWEGREVNLLFDLSSYGSRRTHFINIFGIFVYKYMYWIYLYHTLMKIWLCALDIKSSLLQVPERFFPRIFVAYGSLEKQQIGGIPERNCNVCFLPLGREAPFRISIRCLRCVAL